MTTTVDTSTIASLPRRLPQTTVTVGYVDSSEFVLKFSIPETLNGELFDVVKSIFDKILIRHVIAMRLSDAQWIGTDVTIGGLYATPAQRRRFVSDLCAAAAAANITMTYVRILTATDPFAAAAC